MTGGTSGIGRASATLFAAEGAKVAITGRRAPESEAVLAEITAAGGEALFIQSDLQSIAAISGVVAQVVSRFGRLDCAFNNAGVSGGGPIGSLDEELWDKLIATNLKAACFCLQAEVAQMKKQGSESILFNGSVLASIGLPATSIYGASKGGVVSLARNAAVELGPYGIRVNAINPSITRTPMTQTCVVKGPDGKDTNPFAVGIPLGRLAEPEEISAVAAFRR